MKCLECQYWYFNTCLLHLYNERPLLCNDFKQIEKNEGTSIKKVVVSFFLIATISLICSSCLWYPCGLTFGPSLQSGPRPMIVVPGPVQFHPR